MHIYVHRRNISSADLLPLDLFDCSYFAIRPIKTNQYRLDDSSMPNGGLRRYVLETITVFKSQHFIFACNYSTHAHARINTPVTANTSLRLLGSARYTDGGGGSEREGMREQPLRNPI